MKRQSFPTYCLHRATDQAYVTVRIGGKRTVRYLGGYGSESSFVEYRRTLTETGLPPNVIEQAVQHTRRQLLAGQSPPSASDDQPLTVLRLYNEFQKWAPTHYRLPNGEVSREVQNFVDSFRDCLDLLGGKRVGELTRADLLAVRQRMIDRQLSRKVINQRIGRIVRVFVWGGDEDRTMVPDSVAAAFRLVKPLKPFRSEAPEKEPVGPVSPEDLAAVLAVAHPVLKAMLTLQLLTGMRPGECRLLKKKMVKKIDGRWVADMGRSHKMAYKGKQKHIPIGPQALKLLQEWMKNAKDDQHLFRPEFSPLSKGRKRLPFYTKSAYTLSVRRACQKAGVEEFGPNRVRHLAATEIRRMFGLEAAQAVLGHSHHSTTERYASPVSELAAKVAEQRG